MKTKISLLLAVLMLLVITAVSASAAVDYTVIEPSGFAGSSLKYPVMYVMPENGYSNSKTNPMAVQMQEAMRNGDSMGMLIVLPSFSEGDDLREELAWLVNEIDNVKYAGKTIAEAGFRAIAGMDVGGYMAYTTMLDASGAVAANPELFGFVASTRGRFAADSNPWYAKYGSIYDKLSKAKSSVKNYFTYMDTPVDDPMANADGSTNDLGYMFMKFGTAAEKHEYTARPGKYNAEFMKESAKRIANRFTNYMMGATMSQNSSVSSVLVTSADKTVDVSFSVSPTGSYPALGATGVFHKFDPAYAGAKATVKVAVMDPDDANKVLDSETVSGTVTTWGKIAGTVTLKNVTNGRTCPIKVTITVMGATFEAASSNMVCIEDSVFDGENQKIDLMGNWYFNYTGKGDGAQLNVPALTAAEYTTWDVVNPCLGWWTNDFGNLPDAQAAGNAYYVREFDLPAKFTTQNPMVSIGKVDDRVEVFINGKRVGGLGIDADGSINSEKDTWSQHNAFVVDPSVLNYGGKNVIVVRAWNNDGGGGWYEGPIAIGSESAMSGGGSYTDRFYEETYYSNAIGKEMPYLIYLPKNYGKTDRYYPTMYLFHQFSSSHTSYMIDGVNVLLDEAIEEGLLDDLIVVIPNSDPNSWWKDQWETMVVEDLIPHIDANYRTVKDARYRFTAGCSMGGQGAASIALTNPDLFSGFAAFYGAFYGGYPAYNYFFSFGDSMGDISPITVAKNEGAEYMKNFSMAFICGNQDDYTFGLGKIELHQLLEDYGVDHYFLIENGRHEGAFYLPRFKETLSYVWKNMYEKIEFEKQDVDLSKIAYAELKTTKDGLTLTFAAKDIIEKYFAENPDSPYTKTETPALNIPLRITVTQNGRQYQALLEDHVLEPGQQASVITLSAEDFVAITRSTGGFDPTKKFTYKIEGAIFDNGWVVLGEVSDELMAAVGLLPETGDHSNVMLYAALLAVSMGVCALLRKKSRA